MMKHVYFLCICLLACVALHGAIGYGENILANGELVTDRTDTPPMQWEVIGNKQYFEFCTSGGPQDQCFVRLVNRSASPTTDSTSLRQFSLFLVEGEKYKFTAWVRSVDFAGKKAGVLLCNAGWQTDVGVYSIPANQEWTRVEKEFTAFKAPTGEYLMVLFASAFTGEIDFADVRLEALSEGAQKWTSSLATQRPSNDPLLVPWEPLLQRIPADNPVVSFKLFGEVSELAKQDIVIRVSDVQQAVSQPLTEGVNAIRLPEGAAKGTLTVSIVERESGAESYSCSYPYAVVEIPKVTAGDHRRLNNLCTEVLNRPIAATTEPQSFRFATLRDGWIFIAAQNAAVPQLKITLDDELVVIQNDTPRLENFREVSLGEHTLTVTGAANGGNLVVRSIAETLNYCPGANSFIGENPPYDWDFQFKYGLPAITTQNGGAIPEDKYPWFRQQGYHWITNQMTTGLKNPEDMTARLNGNGGMNSDRFDGVTCDEQFFSQPSMLQKYTSGLHAYTNPKNHVIYSWIVGKPSDSAIDANYLSESMNSCGGRGKLIIEAYSHTLATEHEAREFLNSTIVDTVSCYRKTFPNVLGSLGVILGNFNQCPRLTLQHHPEVDMKYYLDMQFNLLANHPAIDGVATVGYWGSYYADHEFHRWSFLLLRHYVVEGNTTMLSDKYGFKYIPEHVVNGDFRGSFDGWAVDGNVTLDSFDGFGGSSQHRWGGNNGVGDTFAVFTKTGDEISTLKQTAKGLTPGKAYLLQFCTFDVDWVKAKNSNWRDFGIRATLGDGATIRDDLSWQHIDKRGVNGGAAQTYGVARPNLHHIVFIANAPEVEITLDNKLAAPGEHLGVNFFSVTPFLMEE